MLAVSAIALGNYANDHHYPGVNLKKKNPSAGEDVGRPLRFLTA